MMGRGWADANGFSLRSWMWTRALLEFFRQWPALIKDPISGADLCFRAFRLPPGTQNDTGVCAKRTSQKCSVEPSKKFCTGGSSEPRIITEELQCVHLRFQRFLCMCRCQEGWKRGSHERAGWGSHESHRESSDERAAGFGSEVLANPGKLRNSRKNDV